MAICITLAGKALAIATTAFSLSWVHSVEKTEWREDWKVIEGQLQLERAWVKGSGAGMEPGDAARLHAGWWVWEPDIAPVPELNLAVSGATVSGWKFCDGSGAPCIELEDQNSDIIKLATCPENSE